MCWNSRRRSWPLATRLTVWYTAAVAALLAAAVAALHASISWDSERELGDGVGATLSKAHARREAFLQMADPDAEEAAVRVTDPAGQTVYESQLLARDFPPGVFPRPGGRADRAAADGRPYTLFSREFDGWRYHLAVSRADDRRFVALVYRRVGLVTLPLLAASGLAGLLIARAGLRPLRSVAADVRAVSADRLDRRLEVRGVPRELAGLADSFNATMDRLQSAVARLDQFAADVAHELRTPVHNLRTAAELALRGDRPADEYRRTLTGVVDEADRVARLIDRLLLLARLADPRAGLAPEPTDVAAELADVREFFEPAAADAGVAVAVHAAAGLAHPLDRSLFRRAVSNLVANALAATPAGGRVELRAAAGSGGLTVEVADTGRGIPADALPRLFDRYYRPPGADRGGGLGLGLAIVKRVAELHGGSVAVAGRSGGGTAVRLTFPGAAGPHDTPVTNLTRG